MTKADWDLVLCGDWTGDKFQTGDEVIVVYRCNWYKGRAYRKADPHYIGNVLYINEKGIEFEDGKKLSYKSIYDISDHSP